MKNSKKGMTLLEIVIAVTLFSVMSIFITQITRNALRQKNKITRDVKKQRVTSNLMSIIQSDFNGVTLFFDFNKNLEQVYIPEGKDLEDIYPLRSYGSPLSSQLIYNFEFDFYGEEDALQFMTFSSVMSDEEGMTHQLLRIKYDLQDCPLLKSEGTTKCLVRKTINPQDDKEILNRHVLLRGVKSVFFAFLDPETKDWKKEWEISQENLSKKNAFPSSVKMSLEWEDKKIQSKDFYFAISYPSLRNQEYSLPRLLLFVEGQEHEINKKEEEEEERKREDKESKERVKRLQEKFKKKYPNASPLKGEDFDQSDTLEKEN